MNALYLNSETDSEDRIKIGDKIEAKVTPECHATTIMLQIPWSSPAPPSTRLMRFLPT